LTEHDSIVTSIDWCPKRNMLLSCSQDRNAYVWKFENGQWKPTLVILRINRAATYCAWSPNEDKFAVASGSKLVSVCYYEQDNDWWVSKHLKKDIDSTVLSVAWHPNNVLLALGGSDGFCRVVSAWVKNLDQKPGPTAFGSKLPFALDLGSYTAGGWVISVKWSPSGNQLAYASHNSSLTIINCPNSQEGNITQQIVKFSYLPCRDILWLSETSIVGVGYECNPILFQKHGETWKDVQLLDKPESAEKSGTSAMEKFKSMTTMGAEDVDQVLPTKHQNAINCIQLMSPGMFSTTGLDGSICIWNVKTLEQQFSGLKI
jgi:actin related protein 2/3 complex subunit 1A/1B